VGSGWTVLWPLLALVAGVLLEAALAARLSARGKGWLALAAGVAALAGVLSAWPEVLAGRPLEAALGAWDGPIQLAYRVDGLSFLFALLGTGLGAAVLLYAVGYMEHEAGTTRFYALVLLFIAGFVHLVYAADLFLVYASWEVIGLCSFLLVGFWYRRPEAAYGARKVLTMTHLAGYGLLLAVLLLHARTGATLLGDARLAAGFTTGIFLLVLVAVLAKSVQFPLHGWIPDAMAAPTPVSALLHAACYVKAGVYLLARLHGVVPWAPSWGAAVSWLGAVTLVVGALFMLAQRDLKRLLAFSTVSQIGYMMVGLGLGTPLGIAAGLLHCVNHALFKGGLFLCAGAVQHACGTRDMDALGGLARRMPRTTALWLVGAGSIAGLPLLSGFASKWLLYDAALEAGEPLLALVPWLGSVLTVFAFLQATSGVFLGDEGPASAGAHEVSWTMTAGGGALAAGSVLLGVAPQLAVRFLVNPLLPALGRAPITGVSWLGMATGEGAWFATGGLALGIVALLVGGVAYLLPVRAGGAGAALAGGPPTVFTGGEPLGPQGRLGASDFARTVQRALAPAYRALDADRLWLAAWRALGRAADAVAAPLRAAERRPAAVLGGVCVALFAIALLAGAPVLPLAAPVTDGGAGPLPAALALALLGLLVASAAIPSLRKLVAPLAVAGALAVAGLLAEGAILRTALLEGSAVAALALLWRTTATRGTRASYLAAVALSALGMVGGAVAAAHGQGRLAVALLVAGYAVKLGLVPLWCWVPLVAEAAPATVAGLVVAVVDVAAFGELAALRSVDPWIFAAPLPWLALGAASATLGALLALAQRDLRRLLAFSTVADMGLLAVALALGGPEGLAGAVVGAAVHALAKALLFVSLAGPEAEGAAPGSRGLAARHPLAAIGFLVGALAVLGVPPTLGYAAHWRIFAAASGALPLLALLAAGAMLSVATYARAIALFWWGEDAAPAAPRAYGRRTHAAAVLLLAAALLAGGVWPRLLGGVG
jgi:NADH:ubiquinone oxidoreductase subunit 5 (subunit L)/multisubunit Na+/H+ antiporter MnhA subunit